MLRLMSVVEVSDMLLQHSSWPGKMRLQEQATSIMICQNILHIFSIVMINVIVQYCMAVDCITTIVVTTPTSTIFVFVKICHCY